MPVASPLDHLTSSEHVSLDDTLGALLIGEILTAVFFGITSVQIYVYCGRCQQDGNIMKRAVLSLWVVDALHLALISHSIYYYAVINFMDPQKLLDCPWTLAVDMIVMGINDFIVSIIFIYRLWRLSKNTWLLVLTLPLAFTSFIGAVGVGIVTCILPSYIELNARYAWLWYTTFVAQALCDCAISVSLCIVLVRQRTGFRRTDTIIKTLIMYSVNTCALTSTMAIAAIITYYLRPRSFIFITLAMVLPKLMLNSLLALLNSRSSLREQVAEPISVNLSELSPRAEAPSNRASWRTDMNRVTDRGVEPCKLIGVTVKV